MRWTEVRVTVPLGWQELVAELFAREPCTSVVFGPSGTAGPPPPPGTDYVRTFLPDDADSPVLREELRTRLAKVAEASGASELADLELHFEQLPPEDYANAWRQTWRPFRVGRICVVPPWREYTARAGEVVLSLEPGGVFGSGRHATTRACLGVLQDRVANGARVLDAGSGSGILSVAAALLGAGHVMGFDVDRNAARYARSLASDNGVAERCTFRTGGFEVLREEDSLRRETVAFDGVLANIYSDIIVAHASELRERLRPGGWFVFSGCPAHHARTTRAAIDAAGLTLEGVLRRGRWWTFEGTRAPCGRLVET